MPGASSSRDEGRPLSLGARAALYTLLAALVGASFVLTPGQPRAATPTTVTPVADRVAPVARALIRAPRDVEDVVFSPSPSPSPEAVPAADAASADVVEPAPDPTAEPTPAPPTPRPATPRPVAIVTNATTLWAEGRMLELINASRVRGGLVPLTADVSVADTARAHSAAEAQVRYVYHDGPDGTAKSRDVPACGTGWYGENTGKIWNDNVDALHIEFMNEPWEPINHRTNIMDPNFRRVGIGAVIGPDAMYMTMVFCR